MPERHPTTGAILAFLAATFFGISGVVAGGVFDTVEPTYVAQARSIIAAVLLLLYAWWRKALRPGPGIWRLVLLGLNLATVNVTFYWAIDRLGVGPGATVQFLAPVLVLIWLAAVRKEPIAVVAWVASVVAVLGIGLVTEAWTMDSSDLIGVASGLVSAFLFASYLVYGEYLGERYRPATVASWGFVFASVFWAIVLPWWTFPFEDAGTVWLGLIVVGIVGTAIPFILDFFALAMTSSGIVGIIATLEPPIAAFLAAVFLDQQLGAIQWLGIFLVAGAVAVVQWRGLGAEHETTSIV
ncbi:MAG: EamA family transporter [Acidimicrobiia bacterium]|nr:EamA family transporter [Acidimicrobiia bacterium]